MLKLVGIVMIISSCSVMGISLNRDMRRRQRTLKNHIDGLHLIKAEILFKNAPLDSIILLLQKNCGGQAAEFYRKTFDNALKGLTFSSAAEKNYSLLKKDGLTWEDIEILRNVCGVLGRYDSAYQAETINKSITQLEGALGILNGEIASKGKLYKAIGATAGIVLALIAI